MLKERRNKSSGLHLQLCESVINEPRDSLPDTSLTGLHDIVVDKDFNVGVCVHGISVARN